MEKPEDIQGGNTQTKDPLTSKTKSLVPILLKILESHPDFSVGYKEGLGFSLLLCR